MKTSDLEKIKKALEDNHKWHGDYDDIGGYPESSLEENTLQAIGIVDRLLQIHKDVKKAMKS